MADQISLTMLRGAPPWANVRLSHRGLEELELLVSASIASEDSRLSLDQEDAMRMPPSGNELGGENEHIEKTTGATTKVARRKLESTVDLAINASPRAAEVAPLVPCAHPLGRCGERAASTRQFKTILTARGKSSNRKYAACCITSR